LLTGEVVLESVNEDFESGGFSDAACLAERENALDPAVAFFALGAKAAFPLHHGRADGCMQNTGML